MNVTLSLLSRSRDRNPKVLRGISSLSVKLRVSSTLRRLAAANQLVTVKVAVVGVFLSEQRLEGWFLGARTSLETSWWRRSTWLPTSDGANTTLARGSFSFRGDFAVPEMTFCRLGFLIHSFCK